jgi:hypothetical protein
MIRPKLRDLNYWNQRVNQGLVWRAFSYISWRLSATFVMLDPAPVTALSHKLIYTPQPHDGPMLISVEFKVDCAHGREFVNLMREVRLIHLRNGAYSWQLNEDLTRPNTFCLEMIVPSWNEHLLQNERLTKTEKEVLEKACSLHTGTTQPEERIYLSVSKELFMPRQCEFQASTLPKNPPNL